MVNYEEIYALFDGVTPLPKDCGAVCGALCCTGDGDEGMLLFPGEEALLDPACVRPAEGGRPLFVCGGRCDRERRPLSCRLFPLFPLVTPEGRIKAVYDPRAYRLCPLVRLNAHVRLRRDFVRAVRRAGRLLMRDPAARAFLTAQSREIEELDLPGVLEVRAPICRR